MNDSANFLSNFFPDFVKQGLNTARNLAKKKIIFHGIFPNDDFERILRNLPFDDTNLKQASMNESFRYSNLNYGEFIYAIALHPIISASVISL